MTRIKQLWTVKAFLLGTFASLAVHAQTAAPTPYGLTPNSRQIEWYHREQQAFIHFNMNTFTNSEWGNGNESENLFNPTNLDCGQWMRVFKSSGITTAILVIKHHDGFCLWPTAYTKHSVKYDTTWRNGKGDVLREFTDSCHAYGIKAAIYLSPWDLHQSAKFRDSTINPNPEHRFGTSAYVDYYCNQIVELCKDKPYGPFYEIWQDGAGDIASITLGDYRKWTDTLHKYMPECVVWATKVSDSCGDVHWVGNEGGVAGDPCWSTCNMFDVYKENGQTEIDGNTYIPAETNTSISNGGWFWHSGETAKDAWALYFTSVARNTVLLLNFPPNTTGWMSTADSTAGARMGSYIYGTFRTNLLAGATATALHTRGPEFDPKYMLDSNESTYFASADGNNTDTITFTPKSAITFDCILLQEVITLGERSQYWSVDAYSNNTWTTISAANNKQCIAFKRSVQCSQTTATHVRLRITGGRACPAIHTFGVYKQTQVTPPSTWNGLMPRVDTTTTMVSSDRAAAFPAQHSILRMVGNRILLPAGFGAGTAIVNVFDMQGRCVLHALSAVNGFEQRISLPSLKAGSYLIKCNIGNRTLERKFVALRTNAE